MKKIGKYVFVILFLFFNSAFWVGECGEPEYEGHEGPYMTLYVNGEMLNDSLFDIPSDGGVYRINSNHGSVFFIGEAYANTDTIYDIVKHNNKVVFDEWNLCDAWYDVRYWQSPDESDDTYPDNSKLYLVVTLLPNEGDEDRTLSFYFPYEYQCVNWLTLRQSGKSTNP